jgi:hypothetical protein
MISSEKLSLEATKSFYYRTFPSSMSTAEIKTFQLYSQSDSTLVFHADIGNEKRVFLLDTTLQNVRFIDQVFQEHALTNWYYGSPLHYHEQFTLENMVSKPIHKTFEFTDQFLLVGAELKGRFLTRKTYRYSDELLWLGYQDSVFSLAGDFIRIDHAAIEYDQQELPQQVNYFGGISPDQMFVKTVLRFEYDYYE